MDQKKYHTTSDNYDITLKNISRSHVSFFMKNRLLLFSLVIIVFIIYSSSIQGPFVLDDIDNIRDNPQIRLTALTSDGIINAGFNSLISHRPVANISFALNYYLNRYDVAGYHLVNILLHIITGIILFYFIKVTLILSNFQNMNIEFEKNTSPAKRDLLIHNFTDSSILASQHSFGPALMSFFATFIWLVHPIQTQTVSYIVQRMNCMAAMFYILSLLCYAKGRLANTKRKKQLLFLGCILSGTLALGSKEIAATLPFFIFLYEWFFFQKISLKWFRRNSIYVLFIFLFILLLSFLFLGPNPIKIILNTYNTRDFTLWQRVLTEFRVVIFYISLLIFPHPIRLNLLHDFPISQSFIDPITTLLSFIAILGLLVMAIWLSKKERLFSFCILWFMGNLVMESSVIGLEIIFEHRVYLPSMFFILIIVVSASRFINSKWIGGVLLCAVAIIFSVWTYQRNIVWSDDVILWEDCVKKSPHNWRQHYNLGVVLACRRNDDDAIKHYLTSLKIKPDHTESYYNLGNALARKGNAEAAIYNFQKTLRLNPGFFKSYYNIARIMSNQGKTVEAIRNYQKALSINSEMPESLYNLAWIFATSENKTYRNGDKAIEMAEKLCMLTGYQQPLALDALAAAYAESGRFDDAVATAKKALKLVLKAGPKELNIGLQKRIKLYQTKQPYRQTLRKKNHS